MSKSSDLSKRHEECRLKPYRDTQGVLTIGWGTNIENISQEEADWLFQHRWENTLREASILPFYDALNEPRKAVVENMLYNMGLNRFMGFKQFQAAVAAGNWKEARHQMLYNTAGDAMSPWAKQVGYRAMELGQMMLTGEWL